MGLDITGFGAVANFATNVIDRFVPDATANAAAKNALAAAMLNGQLAQAAAETDLLKAQVGVDQAEAANTNWFVAGWRPAVGWVCVLGLLYSFVVRPLAGGVAAKHGVPLEALDMGTLGTLLFGMLGLGAARTIEKIQGAAGNH